MTCRRVVLVDGELVCTGAGALVVGGDEAAVEVVVVVELGTLVADVTDA